MILALLLFGFLLSLVLAWALRPGPSTPPPVHRFLDTPRARNALHETGHALAAWACTSVSEVKLVRIHDDGGQVIHRSPDPSCCSPDEGWCLLVIKLAGLAMEIRAFKKFRSGPSLDDLRGALAIARTIVPTQTTPPWAIPTRTQKLPFENMFSVCIDEERAVLHAGYAKAHAVLEAYGETAWAVAAKLLDKRELTEKDLTPILGTRAFLRVIGLVRPTFVPPHREAA